MIREWNHRDRFRGKSLTVVRGVHGGHFVKPHWEAVSTGGLRPLYVCDTADEAEQVRQVLEAEREAVEAVRRSFEQRLLTILESNNGRN